MVTPGLEHPYSVSRAETERIKYGLIFVLFVMVTTSGKYLTKNSTILTFSIRTPAQ